MTSIKKKQSIKQTNYCGKYKVALIGNPNVGKSTLFNNLTHSNQHTGNWNGKTVDSFHSHFILHNCKIDIIDLPGTYSLSGNSIDEKKCFDAINYINPDLIVMVIDACLIERNLFLLFELLELDRKTALCVNLMDEAEKNNIKIYKNILRQQLNIPIIFTNAKNKNSVIKLKNFIHKNLKNKKNNTPDKMNYTEDIERLIRRHQKEYCESDISRFEAIKKLQTIGCLNQKMKEQIIRKCEIISNKSVKYSGTDSRKQYRADKILTSRIYGIPIMLAILSVIIWITVAGANIPSQIISYILGNGEKILYIFLSVLNTPPAIISILVDGIYRTASWVISVMFPPMAIFFSLFAVLEESGYLARIAFNLDNLFSKVKTNGKQILTM